jgi:hypothetical protein
MKLHAIKCKPMAMEYPLHPTHRAPVPHLSRRETMKNLAFAIAFVLLITWIVGLTGVVAVGPAIHLCLVGAIVLFAFSFLRDRHSVV